MAAAEFALAVEAAASQAAQLEGRAPVLGQARARPAPGRLAAAAVAAVMVPLVVPGAPELRPVPVGRGGPDQHGALAAPGAQGVHDAHAEGQRQVPVRALVLEQVLVLVLALAQEPQAVVLAEERAVVPDHQHQEAGAGPVRRPVAAELQHQVGGELPTMSVPPAAGRWHGHVAQLGGEREPIAAAGSHRQATGPSLCGTRGHGEASAMAAVRANAFARTF
jgi:hypothetical protein